MPRIALKLGDKEFRINTDDITPPKMDSISDMLVEVRLKNSPFGKYPLDPEETLEAWEERVRPTIMEESKKKDNESNEEFLKRIFKTDLDKRNIIFDTLRGLGEIFNQRELITKESFNQASYSSMKGFIISILKSIDFPTADFE